MRVLIVDDEAVARRRLRGLLEEIGDVEIVGEADDGTSARAAVVKHRPDVVLLDIHMPGDDGLRVANDFVADGPRVIFTTAYDEHAVAAFERAAVDYLLKPIPLERLARALERARKQVPSTTSPRLAARRGTAIEFFDPRDIASFEARDGYTAFRSDGQEILVEDTIQALDDRLAGLGFVRVHRGGLVNVDRVKRLEKDEVGTAVVLDDGTRLAVSRRRLTDLKRRLGLS